MLSKKYHSFLILTLMAIGIGIRLIGISHGYPSLVTGDERPVCKNVVGFLVNHSLEPEHFNYPEFYSYLFGGALYFYYLLGGMWQLGYVSTSAGFTWFFSPGEVALVGRILSALMGGLAIGIVWMIGKRAYGFGVAMGGALFATTSVSLVGQARFALPDIAMVFLCQVALLLLLEVCQRGHWRTYVLAGLLIGIATSTKYNAGMLCFGMLSAHVVQCKGKPLSNVLFDSRLFLSGAAILLGFVAGSPYWVVSHSYEKYIHFLRYEHGNMHFNLVGDAGGLWGFLYEIVTMEWAWGILGLAGCSFALYKRDSIDLLILSIILPTLIYIGSWPKFSLHYISFVIPMLGLLGARFLIACVGKNTKIIVPIFFLLVIPNGLDCIKSGSVLRQKDVRIDAAEWIEQNIQGGAVLGIYSNQYAPMIKKVQLEKKILDEVISAPHNREEVTSVLSQLRQDFVFYNTVALEYSTTDVRVPMHYRGKVDLANPKIKYIFKRDYLSYEHMKQLGVEFVILPASAYSRFFEESGLPQPDSAEYFHYMRNRNYINQFFNDNENRFEVVREFLPYNGDTRGKITIFRLI